MLNNSVVILRFHCYTARLRGSYRLQMLCFLKAQRDFEQINPIFKHCKDSEPPTHLLANSQSLVIYTVLNFFTRSNWKLHPECQVTKWFGHCSCMGGKRKTTTTRQQQQTQTKQTSVPSPDQRRCDSDSLTLWRPTCTKALRLSLYLFLYT